MFVNQAQYGYHIDYVQYCRYLKSDYYITYICWDYNLKKIYEPGIKIIYVSRRGNILKRNTRFIHNILKCIKKLDYSFIFNNYFIGVSILTFFCKRKHFLHLDIRTGYVRSNFLKRKVYNTLLLFESFFFKSISIISEGLRVKLGINKGAFIVPLGANKVCLDRKSTHLIHLIYVGILSNRHIEDTIKGVSLFLKMYPYTDLHYTIIGDGWGNEKECLQKEIDQLGLNAHISLKGYVPFDELGNFFEIANIGVSYIPITPYYDFQPATKTFEYLMTGMPVIATSTFENKQVVNKSNGVLINDSAESFAEGLSKLFNSYDTFEAAVIIKSVEKYEWSQIIQTLKENILS